MDHVKDGPEDWLAASATDQETIHIVQFDQVFRVSLSHWACVQNASLLSDLVGAVTSQPISDDLYGFLRLVGTGYLARVKSPDWLVCYDYLGPVRLVHAFLDGLELLVDNFLGHLSLPLVLILSNAVDHPEVLVQSLLYFHRDGLLALLEEPATFIVANKDPFYVIVCKLISRDFSSEVFSLSVGTDILGSNHNMVGYSSFGQIQVQHTW